MLAYGVHGLMYYGIRSNLSIFLLVIVMFLDEKGKD